MQFAPTGSHRWWLATFSVLLLGSLIYTYAGTVSRETVRANWIPEHSVPFTLDGMAFMKVAYPEDYAGISWLNAHVRGAPVVIEADGADYDWRSRVVQFTGLPTLFGGIHEPEQRYGDQLGPRQAALEAIYSARGPDVTSGLLSQFGVTGCPFGTPKAARCLARALLRRLDVSYVYVGSMERLAWPQGVTKFAGMPGLHLAFRDGNTAIYHVIGSAT